MGNIGKTMMIVSLVAVIICFALSMWITLSLGSENADITFYLMDVVFFIAIIWFGLNIYSSYKKKK